MGAIFENAGQICSAGSRLIIERSLHDGFVADLCRRAESLTLGHGLRNPQMGPVNSAAQLGRVAGFVERARGRGVAIATGGSETVDPQTGRGWFYRPTIATGCRSDDELVQERSEEHTSELQSLKRISYAVFCLNTKNMYEKTHPQQ